MPDISLPVSTGNLPEGFCPQTEQERANAYAAALQVLFPFNFAILNTGSTAPSADNRIYPWYRSNMDGTPDKMYKYVNGFWIAPNPTPASSPISFFYKASLASIDTYDGGETGTVTATTGPMWEVDITMEGRVPLGVDDDHGINTTGGNAEITLNATHLPETLELTADAINGSNSSTGAGWWRANPANEGIAGQNTVTVTNDGGGQPLSLLPPYKVGYWIRRTARIFFRL